MLYRKNVPMWERIVRITLSVAAIAAGILIWGRPGALLLVAGGAGILLTGFFGFCPACALVGRRIAGSDDTR